MTPASTPLASPCAPCVRVQASPNCLSMLLAPHPSTRLWMQPVTAIAGRPSPTSQTSHHHPPRPALRVTRPRHRDCVPCHGRALRRKLSLTRVTDPGAAGLQDAFREARLVANLNPSCREPPRAWVCMQVPWVTGADLHRRPAPLT